MLMILLLALAAGCGPSETASLHGYVVSDADTAITLHSSGEGGTSTSGKNMVHLLVTWTDSPRADVGRVAVVKIEDKKGANLKIRDGIKLLCKIDTGESVGGITAGFEFDDCRLIAPYADFTWDGYTDKLNAAIRRYKQ